MEEPVERLLAAAHKAGVANSVCILPEGETDVSAPVGAPFFSQRAAQG
jgi:hypothetical protein